MTLEQARSEIGSRVLYQPGWAGEQPEPGIITSVNDAFVFVRFGTSAQATATRPEDLELVVSP